MIAEILCQTVKLFTGARGHWDGCEPSTATQRVYFANHTSSLDFLVLWSVLPTESRRKTRPVAASDYWRRNWLRLFLAEHVFEAVLIERNKVTRSNNPLHQLLAVLESGKSLILFPEGTRSTESGLKPFKSGLYHIGKAMPNVELVPVYIDNANRVLPKGEFLPIPFICSVHLGAPLRVLPDEQKEAFLIRAREAVQQLATI